jgi:2-keto-4-pentenoate hydratase/2-oxohepta-3-ene-1,7-dioic acid hydratase in catechol pathway
MKLIRFGEVGNERPGILTESGVRKDASAHVRDWDSDFFRNGGFEQMASLPVTSLPDVPKNARWGACVARPWKIICIAANYHDHAKESGKSVPPEPMIFMKSTTAINGPYDPIRIPRKSAKTDWEIELAFVIGKDARYLKSEKEAARHIFGYCLANDVSERAFQIEHYGQFTKGKSCDTFCPLGPFLVTSDELADPCNLSMKLKVNGKTMQDSNTSEMVYKPYFLVHYLSQFMTLEAGDVVCTGTPAGVGAGRNPQVFLKVGDRLDLEIEGLGNQSSTCIES